MLDDGLIFETPPTFESLLEHCKGIQHRASLRQALESLRNLDLGIGATLNFSAERHQGLDSVYFTRVEGGRWVPVTDWTAAVRA